MHQYGSWLAEQENETQVPNALDIVLLCTDERIEKDLGVEDTVDCAAWLLWKHRVLTRCTAKQLWYTEHTQKLWQGEARSLEALPRKS